MKPTTNPADQFESIVSTHYEALFRFAMSLTRSESDACDLTQQTFYIWATKGHQLRDVSKAKSWLFTILHRTFLTARHRQARISFCGLEEMDQLPAPLPEFHEQTDCTEVLPALAKLDEVYQAAVALFYLEEYSYKEIAAILEIPMGTVKSRLARGIAQLREILASSKSNHASHDHRRWVISATRPAEHSGASRITSCRRPCSLAPMA